MKASDRRPAAAPTTALDGSPILTVTQLTHRIRNVLEETLGSVWVTGEVSNFRRPASGHCYFTLKDEGAQISVVMWRGLAAALKFQIEDGLSLIAKGELTVYEPRGQYQLVLRRAEPLGAGALQLAFLQLKEKLAAEGLFDKSRKKPLPAIPNRIGIVTSPTGAAIRDMLNVILRRWPAARILVIPARVQGREAAPEIAKAIETANTVPGLDVLIVGRGGGSLEDLWPFNEEIVARAIAASRIPIVSAVGHETDFTIADFAADVRALTPTDAAVKVAPDRRELLRSVASLAERLGQALLGRTARARERLAALGRSYALRRPFDRIRVREQRLDDLCQRFYRSVEYLVALRKQRLSGAAARLESLGPLAVLQRGYSLTFTRPEDRLLRDASAARPGTLLRTRLAKGEVFSRVETPSPAPAKTAAPKKTPARARKKPAARKRPAKKTPKRGEPGHGQK